MLRSLGKYYYFCCSILARSILSTVPLRPIYKGAIKTSLERVKPNRFFEAFRSLWASHGTQRQRPRKKAFYYCRGTHFLYPKKSARFLTLYTLHTVSQKSILSEKLWKLAKFRKVARWCLCYIVSDFSIFNDFFMTTNITIPISLRKHFLKFLAKIFWM